MCLLWKGARLSSSSVVALPCPGTKATRDSDLIEATALAEAVSGVALDGCLFSLGQPLRYALEGEFVLQHEIFEEGEEPLTVISGTIFLDL